ncbi:hypothetical protein [Eubacterium oxidoreducens]|uniref:Uncharacterized protein n=1 Tax=Eubacterium oxidoreducens TaxID=1732 RepID=A0A1G6B278_EUBOX|nr:hypothetical protein [Eubacterium oxidoreducens]SDB14583.1 hypothetical protein SAMN02910417_01060 [Eubacterium oxidoreducens]
MIEIKYHKGFVPTYPVDKKSFEDKTHREFPYAQKDNYYALCPICENPVILLGLKKTILNKKPHARHTKYDVEGISDFEEIKYEKCPNHKKTSNYILETRNETAESIELYHLARENFDKIIYLIRQHLPIIISTNDAKKLLKYFITHKGWTYPNANEHNLWLMFFRHNAWN